MQISAQKVRFSSTDIKRIYLEAFPKSERMPFFLMAAMSKLWNTQFLGFYDGDDPCGLIYLASNRKMVFVMFLAVDKRLRAKGYGSAILQQVKEMYPHKKILVSIEPCDDFAADLTLRKRRKAFYIQNGYRETGFRLKLNGIEQEILILNGEFVKKEFRSFFLFYSAGSIYPKIWEQKQSKMPS